MAKVTKSELARTLGKSTKVIDDWIALGCPCEKPGKSFEFKLDEVFTWREQYLKSSFGSATNKETEIDLHRARLVKAQADKAELEMGKLQGELVEVNSVSQMVAEEYTTVRNRFLGLPSKVAPLVQATADDHEIHEIIEKEVYDILTELCDDAAAKLKIVEAEMSAEI